MSHLTDYYYLIGSGHQIWAFVWNRVSICIPYCVFHSINMQNWAKFDLTLYVFHDLIGLGQNIHIEIFIDYNGRIKASLDISRKLNTSEITCYIPLIILIPHTKLGNFLSHLKKVNDSITSCRHPILQLGNVGGHHWASTKLNLG